MVSVFASSAVGRGLEFRSGQRKTMKLVHCICCFSKTSGFFYGSCVFVFVFLSSSCVLRVPVFPMFFNIHLPTETHQEAALTSFNSHRHYGSILREQ